MVLDFHPFNHKGDVEAWEQRPGVTMAVTRLSLMGHFCCYGQDGVIIGSRGKYLRVRFEGETRIETLHPTWMVEYLEEKT